MIVIFVFLLFAGAYGVKKIFGYSIEESLFANILFIIAFLLVTGLIGILNIGFYLITAAMLAAFIYGVILTVKQKSFDVYEIITPGISVFIVSSLLYFIAVRNFGFCWWDEGSHWGTAVRHMFLSDKMYYGLQTMGVPMFSYFMVKISGFSEGLVYFSRWVFMWSALVILMKDVKWKSWYIAVAGWALSACIVNIISSEPIYYMDKPLGVLAGVLIAYILLDKDGGIRKDVLIFLGVLILPHIKDSIGAELSVFVLMFSFAAGVIDKGIKSRWLWGRHIIMLLSVMGSYILSGLFKADSLTDYYNIERMPDFHNLISLLTAKSALLVYALFLFSVVIFILSFKSKRLKNFKHNALVKYSGLSGMLLSFYLIIKKFIISLYRSFDMQSGLYFKNALKKMLYESFYEKPTYLLLVFIAGLTLCLILLNKKKSIKEYTFNILSIGIVMIYGFVLAVLYSLTAEAWQGEALSSFRRYFMTVIMAVSIIMLTQILYKTDIFAEVKYKVISILALSVLLLNSFPVAHDLSFRMYGASYISYEYGRKEYGKLVGGDINSIVPEDDKVFIVCQNNGAQWADSGVGNWIHYYIAPRITNFVDFSFGKKYGEEDIHTKDVPYEELLGRMLGYDYVYIDNADDAFYSLYGGMFDTMPDKDRAVYEVADGTLTLIWQGDSVR